MTEFEKQVLDKLRVLETKLEQLQKELFTRHVEHKELYTVLGDLRSVIFQIRKVLGGKTRVKAVFGLGKFQK